MAEQRWPILTIFVLILLVTVGSASAESGATSVPASSGTVVGGAGVLPLTPPSYMAVVPPDSGNPMGFWNLPSRRYTIRSNQTSGTNQASAGAAGGGANASETPKQGTTTSTIPLQDARFRPNPEIFGQVPQNCPAVPFIKGLPSPYPPGMNNPDMNLPWPAIPLPPHGTHGGAIPNTAGLFFTSIARKSRVPLFSGVAGMAEVRRPYSLATAVSVGTNLCPRVAGFGVIETKPTVEGSASGIRSGQLGLHWTVEPFMGQPGTPTQVYLSSDMLLEGPIWRRILQTIPLALRAD